MFVGTIIHLVSLNLGEAGVSYTTTRVVAQRVSVADCLSQRPGGSTTTVLRTWEPGNTSARVGEVFAVRSRPEVAVVMSQRPAATVQVSHRTATTNGILQRTSTGTESRIRPEETAVSAQVGGTTSDSGLVKTSDSDHIEQRISEEVL